MNYVIAGGGTGGHIYPAVAIAERLAGSGSVTMLARSGSMEQRVYESQGLTVATVSSAPLLYSLRSLWRLAIATTSGVRLARKVMVADHADAFIGTGGYVSVPGIIAALMTRVPVFLLEQNTVMGRANKLFAHGARRVFLGFPLEHAHGPRYVVTGNPLRRELYMALAECRSTGSTANGLLFLGGSGGARFVNDLFLQAVRQLDTEGRDLEVIVVTGNDDYGRICDEVARLKLQHVVPSIVAYEDHMERLYCKTRVAVTRGGALALTELAVGGIFAVIVPYPYAVGHHQSRNAAYLESQGLGICMEQNSLNFEKFLSTVKGALDGGKTRMLDQESIFATDAGDLIASAIEQECQHG